LNLKKKKKKEYVYVGGYIQRFENRAAHLHEMWLGYKKKDGPPDLAKPPKAPLPTFSKRAPLLLAIATL